VQKLFNGVNEMVEDEDTFVVVLIGAFVAVLTGVSISSEAQMRWRA
jgi:hypothetical protein